MKTILIISGGTESIFGIKRAKELGYFVVVTDGNSNAPGFKYADDCILASTYDIDQTLKKVLDYDKKQRKINGVICIASDVPKTVAAISSHLNLISVSMNVAQICSDKFVMKKFFKSKNIPIPWFREISSKEQLKDYLLKSDSQFVIKPVDSRGARGVLRISNKSDLIKSYNYSYSFSQVGKVILEKFISGPQLSTESIIINKKIYHVAFADRNYQFLERFSPNIIENGGQLPSQLSPEIIRKTGILLEKVSRVFDIENGILKGDIVIENNEPLIIEVAPRLSGGYFSTHQIPMSTGVDLLGLALKQAMGELNSETVVKPIKKKSIVQRYWFPEEGIVKNIDNFKKYRMIPNVEYLDIRVKIGDKIGPMDSHPSRAGVIITSGENIDKAKNLAEKIINQLKIIVEK